ncbi:MAG: hypothetical protein KAT07_01555, partial [Calditrichia bacterium]|nr:hypothetical protein [Calditrichia bacterium]
MTIRTYFAILLILVLLGSQPIFGQQSADSLQRTQPEKVLPQIQLQEYTIVGLAKISLPRKIRTQVFKEVDIEWSDNQNVYNKELPAITFQFSRVKPSLFQLYDFPWLNSRIHYGSYNEAGILVNMQFKAEQTLPYFSARFLRSDGHVDNAQWTDVGLEAGVHQNLSEGHLLHVSTSYQDNRQGIWRDYQVYQQDWEVQTVFWDLNAALENSWNERIQSKFSGNFYLDDHENGFRYEDRGFDLFAGMDINIKDTKIGLLGKYEQVDLSLANGNLLRDTTSASLLNQYKSSLLTGKIHIQQKLEIASIMAGISYQKSDESEVRSITDKFSKEYINPYASLEIGKPGSITFYVRYRPGAETQHFRQGIRLLPFSELDGLRVLNHKMRWDAGFDLDVPYHINFSVISRFSTVEHLSAVVNPSDSLNAIFTQGGYPGWIYDTIDETRIRELYGKLEWKVSEQLQILGWANFRQSDIRQAG